MSNVENVCPQVLRGVARELRRLAASPPAGIKLVLRDDDLTDVVAHMEGPGKCSITLCSLCMTTYILLIWHHRNGRLTATQNTVGTHPFYFIKSTKYNQM